MPRFYVSFGQAHRHVHGETVYDKDCLLVLTCPTMEDARRQAFQRFGAQWANVYASIDDTFAYYFPRGLMFEYPAPTTKEETMENQHQKIVGYRELTESEITDMNRVKDVGNQIGALIEEFGKYPDYDQRWLAIAKTDLQKGLMSLTRAVARPESF